MEVMDIITEVTVVEVQKGTVMGVSEEQEVLVVIVFMVLLEQGVQAE
jgi:hypothetical protein